MQPFERIVEEHGAVVLRVCRALLGPHDADDAWSETFLAALRAWPDLEPGSNVAAWLVTIAHRKAIDCLRRRARQPVPVGGVEPAGSGAGPPEPPDDALLAAVRALPPKQQAAVVHHYLADRPYREVAALLGTSEAAARRSAADGIAALRVAWTGPGSGARPHAGGPPGVGSR